MSAPISQPMILITQIQRSGGTLLSQLFDGHPEIYAHPHELHIGYPNKWDWPALEPEQGPEGWFTRLYEKRLEKFMGRGYVKPGSNKYAAKDIRPFNFSRQQQYELFLQCIQNTTINSQRDVLNCYFNSFFNAWSDYASTGLEKYITAFCPRVLMEKGSIERFLKDYPDGWILSSVRDPRSWYVSSSRHNRKAYPNVETAIDLWAYSTDRILELQERCEDRAMVVTYDDMVTDTPGQMRVIADRLGIEFQESLTVPTYLGEPILPNSSFNTAQFGVNQNSLDRIKLLEESDAEYIEEHAIPLYEKACKTAGM